jgi:ribosomal protein S18 acetylase RimI-like enzyme
MEQNSIHIRPAKESEFLSTGKLLVKVYSNLEGFPSSKDQPEYYQMLLNIGEATKKPNTELLVAVTEMDEILGAVVYFSDMISYGSGGTATQEKNASGFRLLAVDSASRGLGVGKQLTLACIAMTKKDANQQLIIHSTEFMKIAWAMYEKMGFERSEDLDFMQKELPVYGFRLKL